MTECSREHCHRPARMAVQTGWWQSVVYYSFADAPERADIVCRRHGTELMYSLINSIVLEDTQP